LMKQIVWSNSTSLVEVLLNWLTDRVEGVSDCYVKKVTL
jgi:hypothetical protein